MACASRDLQKQYGPRTPRQRVQGVRIRGMKAKKCTGWTRLLKSEDERNDVSKKKATERRPEKESWLDAEWGEERRKGRGE